MGGQARQLRKVEPVSEPLTLGAIFRNSIFTSLSDTLMLDLGMHSHRYLTKQALRG